jgi:hypothetical protein
LEINEKLEKAALIAGMIFVILILIFILLNRIGILPFYDFSSVQCCALPTFFVGSILMLTFAKKYRVKENDHKTQELIDRTIKYSFFSLATTIVIGGIASVLILMIFIFFLIFLPQYFIFAIPAILIVAFGALIARVLVYIYRGRLIDLFFGSNENKNAPKISGSVEKQPPKEQRFTSTAPTLKGIPGTPQPSGDGIRGTWYSPDKAIKIIFYADKKFDLILPPQRGDPDRYIGGTFRKDNFGHYWIHPEFQGTTKMTTRPIEGMEMEFILEGNRLQKASDDNVQFIKA